MLYLRRFSIAILFALIGCHSVRAQQPQLDCASMEYEHHNLIDYGPLRVMAVTGTVKIFDGYPARGACVGLFAESKQKLLAAAKADEQGRFQIAGIRNGTYWLVVMAEGLCAANVRIVVTNKSHESKTLAAVMKPRGIDVCSYIELKNFNP